MGNFEKLVVLTVLFLSAIVLAFSLGDDSAVEAASPLEEARKQQEEAGARAPGGSGQPSRPGAARGEERESASRSGLLSSEVTPHGAPGEGAPRGSGAEGTGERETEPLRPGLQPAGRGAQGAPGPEAGPGAPGGGPVRILRDATGLETTSLEEFLVYVVQEGDTWNGLARRFYRDTRYLSQLRTANEELEELVAGERILVPVFDLARGVEDRRPYEPTARREPEQARPAGADVYVVQEGDTLSSISLAVYGTATRWEKIYEANKDLLSSPDWLKLGTKLRIPRE